MPFPRGILPRPRRERGGRAPGWLGHGLTWTAGAGMIEPELAGGGVKRMDVNSRSWLFREESLEVIKSIFRRALGAETVREARLLDGGLFNTTYLVTCGAGEERTVLRLGPVERHRIMGFERNLMAAEAYLYDVCRDIGVPCPQVLAWDTSKTAVDRDFMITRYIPSVTMVNAELTEERRRDLCFQLGAYLRRLHQVTGESFGFVSRVLEGRRFDTWGGAFLFEVEDIVGRLEAFGGLTAGEAKAVLAPFYRGRALLDQVRMPHLLHLDVWAGNVLLDRESLEILALIDSDRAVFGDPDFEFAAPWMEDPDLRRGYGFPEIGPGDRDRLERRRLYRAFYVALDAYVGLGEYNNQAMYQDKKKELLELLEIEEK